MHDPSQCPDQLRRLPQSEVVAETARGYEFNELLWQRMSHDPSCPLCFDDLTAEYTKADTEWTP